MGSNGNWQNWRQVGAPCLNLTLLFDGNVGPNATLQFGACRAEAGY